MTAPAAAETSDPRRVILIDLSSLFWTAWHATADKNVSEAMQITLGNVRRCVGQNEGALVAICCDSGRSFRKDIAPEYKANRPEKDHASLGQLDRIKERLEADGYLLWAAPGFEADDVIATNCAAAVSLGHEVLICSADKDLLQLCGPSVKALRTHTWNEVSEADVIAKFGITPAQLGDWLALVGDKSDNIPGAKGIGDKRATDLLKEHSNLAGIYYVLEQCPQNFTPAIRKSLQENEALVQLARKLVTLRADAPINFMEIYDKRDVKPLVEPGTGLVPEESEDMDENDVPISRGPGPKANGQQAQLPIAEATNGNGHTAPPSAAAPAPAAVTAEPPRQTLATSGEDEFMKLLEKRGFAPVEYEKALEPKSTNAAIILAQHLFESRLYSKFTTWQAILATILRGRSMGISATTSLDVFHIIEGKPSPYAYLLVALAEQDPDCEYILPVEFDAKHALWETKHRKFPKPIPCLFTYDQAVAAQLPKSGPKGDNGWIKNPEDMLVKSAGAKLARRVYRRATLGLISVEEMGEI